MSEIPYGAITWPIIKLLIKAAEPISHAMLAHIKCKHGQLVELTAAKRELAHCELEIVEAEQQIYSQISGLAKTQRGGLHEVKEIRKQLSKLAGRLVKLEQVRKTLDRHRQVLERSERHRKRFKITLHRSIARIKRYERGVVLKEQHIRKIIQDAERHISNMLGKERESISVLKEEYSGLRKLSKSVAS